MNSSSGYHPSEEPQEDDPEAYSISPGTDGVALDSHLGASPPASAIGEEHAHARSYGEMIGASNRHEANALPAGEYPVSFRDGKRLDEIDVGLRYWAVGPARSARLWYDSFVSANTRYELYLAETLPPGDYMVPDGITTKYKRKLIRDVPQDVIWSALRPSTNSHQYWYPTLHRANERFLDHKYISRSPGSELIWFGTRYRGLRLDQVYDTRKGFIRWCFSSRREESGWLLRFKDLVRRLQAWRQAHPGRSGPRRRRKTPVILNPVGEAIGPWDDAPGSAGEGDEEYERDGFVQSDNDALEYSSSGDHEVMSDGGADDNVPRDSDNSSTSSDVEMTPYRKYTSVGDSDNEVMNDGGSDDGVSRYSDGSSTSSYVEMTPLRRKRRRTNVVMSEEEESDVAVTSVGKLGRRYRVQHGSEE